MARPKLGEGETQRLQLKISDEEMQAIEDWRFANRIQSKSEAVRRLVSLGLMFSKYAPETEKLAGELYTWLQENIVPELRADVGKSKEGQKSAYILIQQLNLMSFLLSGAAAAMEGGDAPTLQSFERAAESRDRLISAYETSKANWEKARAK